VKIFNEIQQFGAHTCGHKRAAIFTGRLHKPIVFAAYAASEHAISRGLIWSARGIIHGISPEAERIMTQKKPAGNH
jgi:hypothetical protein